MKMIEVFNLMSEDRVEPGTKLILYYDSEKYVYKYHGLYRTFLNDDFQRMEEEFVFGDDFLNYNVQLIPPKEKQYMIKFNMRGLRKDREYLNYDERCGYVNLNDKHETLLIQTKFTKKELQEIKPVREFLEDMKGKYELIEVE